MAGTFGPGGGAPAYGAGSLRKAGGPSLWVLAGNNSRSMDASVGGGRVSSVPSPRGSVIGHRVASSPERSSDRWGSRLRVPRGHGGDRS